ncbi:hypothetical protein M5121_14960, partial [Acinetobacter sp. ANC5681]|nr:hypothetical protein [Acinetobacter sp. ANC5681]
DRKAFADETKAQGEALSKMIYEYDSYTRAEVEDKIRSKGYSEDRVKELTNSIWSQGLSADQRAESSYSVGTANGIIDALSQAEFARARQLGITTQWGTNKIDELLRNIGTSTASIPASVSSPNIASNSINPPQIQSPQMPKDMGSSSPTVNYQFNLAGKQFNLNGPASEQSNINALLSELEQLSRAR